MAAQQSDNGKPDERDTLAFVLLVQFAKEGFPAVDVHKQVAAAHQYADAVMEYRRYEKMRRNPPLPAVTAIAPAQEGGLAELAEARMKDEPIDQCFG